MANTIYDLKIVNQKIREDLKRELPNLTFSVQKDGRRIYLTLVSGNFKPFKALTADEEKGYRGINQYYIDSEESLTDMAKDVMKKAKEIADRYNYDKSDIQSDYFDVNFYLSLYIGSYDKPYQYKSSTSKPTRPPRPERPSQTNENDELLHVFKSGWKLYKRIANGKTVNILVKDKETESNRDDWAAIKGEILTETGFKWTPQFQVFSKWGSMDFIKDVEALERILFKYYVTPKPNATQQMMANVTATPQQEPTPQVEQEPQVEIAQNTAAPVTTRINDLLKTFKDPKDVTDLEVRKFIINTLIDRMDRLETHNINKDFLKIYASQIFDSIYVPSNNTTYHITDGIKMIFTPQTSFRQTKKDLLLRIMDIAGCWCGLDVVFGVYVDIEGDVMSEELKKYAEKIAKENGHDVYIEDFHVGGTLRYRDFYAIYHTLEVAKNFLENRFEASLDSHEFTEKFKSALINKRDFQLYGEDYQGNEVIVDANLYFWQDGLADRFKEYVYILQLGSDAEIYSNSFNLGYKMMQRLIKKEGNNVSYLKGVHPFVGEGAKYKLQLMDKFPELFPKEEQTSEKQDKEVVQAQIDELENFLKLAGDMDEDDKKVILSQILDLHTLLKLI
jgi:hypothetical protein